MKLDRVEIRVKGIVQGVGFRPFVFRLAKVFDLKGSVANTPSGVVIKVKGRKEDIDIFIQRIWDQAPPLARIQTIETREPSEPISETAFMIKGSSTKGHARTHISPDMATCKECAAEIRDKKDRRFDYAFTNCTNCGPRYTIIESLPYDRGHTSMKRFRMCEKCLAEYNDPLDRRFHAQPNACPACGPRLFWHSVKSASNSEAIDMAVDYLKAGKVVALKGLGGFHIAVDAFNKHAIERLRSRKKRPFKPFALMVRDLDSVKALCHVSSIEEELLLSPSAPICLLRVKQGSKLPKIIAPGLKELGIMLPYTPLHHLFFARSRCPRALIMTSGNPRGEPLCTGNREALNRLRHIVDGFLLHDRDIYTGVDDSVVRVVANKKRFIRRARGFAPAPVELKFQGGFGLSVGAELKNTFCLTRDKEAFLSQHIGNLTSLPVLEFFRKNIMHLQNLLEVTPRFVAADLHPDYLSTRYASDTGLPVYKIQHHFAHAASVMAEHEIQDPVLAIVLDGTGYGPDNTIWGGEIILCSPTMFKRIGRLLPFPLPGGDKAARQPWRLALSMVHSTGLTMKELPGWFNELIPTEQTRFILEMIENGLNCPLTSSCGRLFDAVAAITGACLENTYEAQAALELEALCLDSLSGASINGSLQMATLMEGKGIIKKMNNLYELDWRPFIRETLLHGPEAASETALRFHAFLVAGLGQLAEMLCRQLGVDKVVLSGGCMQNRVLLEGFEAFFTQRNIECYSNTKVPANDGGLCLGQAFVAAHLNGLKMSGTKPRVSSWL